MTIQTNFCPDCGKRSGAHVCAPTQAIAQHNALQAEEWYNAGSISLDEYNRATRPHVESCAAQSAPRQWVGLDAEDRLCAKYMQDAPEGIDAVIDYIEAKLKEKNV
jgi:hypothetical protein